MAEEIAKRKQVMAEQAKWDQNSPAWKQHVVKVARENFGGTEDQFEELKERILIPYADRFWDVGCPAPQIRNFEASVKVREGAIPRARRPFRLSAYDGARLEYRCAEMEDEGKIHRVEPEDPGEWSSPAFIVDKMGDALGRMVTDYDGPNSSTEDHSGIPPDAAEVLARACGKAVHTVMDMAWGFSQIPIDKEASKLWTIATPSSLLRHRYLPMGPKQGPGICQSFNDSRFGHLEATQFFVDDFHIGSPPFRSTSTT